MSSFPRSDGPGSSEGFPATSEILQHDSNGRTAGFDAHILDAAPQSIIVAGLDGRIQYWNRFAEEMYGRAPHYAVGRNLSELLPAVSKIREADDFVARIEKGETWTGEVPAQRADGTELLADLTISPVYEDEARLTALVLVSRDITEQKRTYDVLRESENKYRVLVEQASDGIHTYDAEGNFLEMNSQLCEMLGYSRDELLQLNVRDLVPAEDLVTDPIRFEALLAGKTLLRERRLLRKDGSIFHAEISGKMIAGNIMQGIVRDITERKNAEERLRLSEERLRTILEASHDGILIENDEKIVYVNRSYLDLFGYDEPSELVGQSVSLVIAPEDQERLTVFGRTRLGGEFAPAKYEFHGRMKDGALIEVEASVSTSESAGRKYITTFIRDIRERRRLEMLLEAQKQALEMVVSGAPLDEVLAYLARIVERQSGETSVASILLLDEARQLRNGASPSLPESYLEAIDGLTANVEVGTCCSAAASGRAVITPDIAADPKWNGIAHLPLNIGLKAAWSMPIVARNGQVLGTFGTYFRDCRAPSSFEIQVVEILSRTAALAIERKRAEGIMSRSRADLEIRVNERTRELRIANEERIRTLHQLVTVQEDERRRVARDLHDQLGQQMTVLRLSLESIQKQFGGLDGLSMQLGETRKLLRQLDSDVDFLAWKFRPAILDDIGIVAALDQYIGQWSARLGIPAKFDAKRLGSVRLSPDVETNYYRITQEALNNVSKHANAGNVNILLEPRDGGSVLIIEDDGIGFEPCEQLKTEKGMGLIGMRERADLIGGKFEIESVKGGGTTIYVTVPAPHDNRDGNN